MTAVVQAAGKVVLSTRENRPHSRGLGALGKGCRTCGGTALNTGLFQTASSGSPMPTHPSGIVEPVGLGVVEDISPAAPMRNSWSVSSGTVVLAAS